MVNVLVFDIFLKRKDYFPIFLQNFEQTKLYLKLQIFTLWFYMAYLQNFTNLTNNDIQLLLNIFVFSHKDIFHTFWEKIRFINSPTKRSGQNRCHKLFKITFKLRAHHKVRPSITNIGRQLIYLILQTFHQFFILHLLAFVFRDLLWKIIDNFLFFIENILDILRYWQRRIDLYWTFGKNLGQLVVHGTIIQL